MNGVILAGGKSRRFGSEKAFFQWNGEYLYQKQAALASLFCEKVCIACRADQASKIQDYTCLIDQEEDQGPIQGIIQGLQDAQEFCLFLACDLPNLDEETLREIVQTSEAEIVLLRSVTHGLQPLAARWNKSLLDPLLAYYKTGGRAIMPFIKTRNLQPVEVQDTILLNLNHPLRQNKM